MFRITIATTKSGLIARAECVKCGMALWTHDVEVTVMHLDVLQLNFIFTDHGRKFHL